MVRMRYFVILKSTLESCCNFAVRLWKQYYDTFLKLYIYIHIYDYGYMFHLRKPDWCSSVVIVPASFLTIIAEDTINGTFSVHFMYHFKSNDLMHDYLHIQNFSKFWLLRKIYESYSLTDFGLGKLLPCNTSTQNRHWPYLTQKL